LPWIKVPPGVPYFMTEDGNSWTPVGHNDAITWPGLAGLYRRKNIAEADTYLKNLAANGVTCLRLMLEYCQTEHRYLERPVGVFNPSMIHLWDDLFHLCEKHGLRIMLTPFDTFWMRRRWRKHPYNRMNGGPCPSKSQWLTCSNTLAALKNRLAFVTKRWGSSGVLFAWDLWNEVEPIHAGNEVEAIYKFVNEVSTFLRNLEIQIHGKAHLQTVSAFASHLNKYPQLNEVIFRHSALDFATTHFYGLKSLDAPTNTLKAASSTGSLISKAVAEITDNRPFLDSEHGPIRAFRKRNGTLPLAFDEEYFRFMQWAHLASGGAGGGMRWPYRHPHMLTKGMRQAQKSMAAFCQLVDWTTFTRKNVGKTIKKLSANRKVFACGNSEQVIAWIVCTNSVLGMADKQLSKDQVLFQLPMAEGSYQIIFWNTKGYTVQDSTVAHTSSRSILTVKVPGAWTDIALLIRRIE
jgi:mannan endo-1,4-beta-mannosidase